MKKLVSVMMAIALLGFSTLTFGAEAKYKISIARFGLYPEKEPTSYCVGFSITFLNGHATYQDTIVSLEEARGKTEEEIVDLAYEKIREGIEGQITSLQDKSKLLGKDFIPAAKVIKPIVP